MRKLSFRLTGLVSVTVVSIGMLTAGAASAYAQAGSHGSAFAAQAKALGLTSAQAWSLQDRVDSYLTKVEGTQVGINKISLEGGYILLTLPGEQAARDLDAPMGVQEACRFNFFCAYQYKNFVGDTAHSSKIDMYYCSNYSMPWAGSGSFRNNQSPGTKAKFYDGNGNFLTQTLGAPTESSSFNWTPVWFVKPC